MEKTRVVLADDNLNVLRLLTDYFAETPDIELVKCVSDGALVVDAVRACRPDVLVTDIIMPRRDGFRILEELNGLPEAERPRVIVLTGLSRDDFILRAVKLGASYYMVKPFGVLELSARIRSLLRRVRREENRDILSYQGISVNRKTREVVSSGRSVELTLKEFELLVYLLENQSRVVTRDELLNRIWGYEYDGETRTLDMHIRTLRQKLGEEGGACIKTVRGVGYRMIRQEGGQGGKYA